MARSHAFWVILAGAVPTAFRSPKREDLLPTLHQLQRKQPDVTLQWFDRGRLWESPEAARAALLAKLPQFPDRKSDWRPGGSHKDPRARYQLSRDEKRARFKKRLGRPPLGPDPDKPSDSRRTGRTRVAHRAWRSARSLAKPGGPPRDRWQKPGGPPRDRPPSGDRWQARWSAVWGSLEETREGSANARSGDRPYRPPGIVPADRRDRPGRPPGDRPAGLGAGGPFGGRPPAGRKPFGRRPPGNFVPPGPRGRKPPR
jgi:hypothetical protein